MADTPDLGSGAARCAGSTPAPSTLFASTKRSRKVVAATYGPDAGFNRNNYVSIFLRVRSFSISLVRDLMRRSPSLRPFQANFRFFKKANL